MRFSIYSKMQAWPARTPERQSAEFEQQIVHADRLEGAHRQAIRTRKILAEAVAPRFGAAAGASVGAPQAAATPA